MKTVQNHVNLQSNQFLRKYSKSQTLLWFFTEHLTLSLPGTRCAGPNNELSSQLQNTTFQRVFKKLSNNMQADRLCTCGFWLLMFKICGIREISKFEIFEKKFPVLKESNKIYKKLETVRNILSLYSSRSSSNSNKNQTYFMFLIEILALLLRGTGCTDPNTDLRSNSNISNTVKVNNVFTKHF